jgi:hypothetical protein
MTWAPSSRPGATLGPAVSGRVASSHHHRRAAFQLDTPVAFCNASLVA